MIKFPTKHVCEFDNLKFKKLYIKKMKINSINPS